jgi:hypothetical protein
MPVVDILINNVSGNKVISFLVDNAGYNQIFMAEKTLSRLHFGALDLWACLCGLL